MKAGQGKNKGSEFERQVGYKLSLWLSHGERKDLLCRTVGSGAQFTFAKTRNQMAGIPGDLRSQDPLGDKFCNTFTIECKHWANLQIAHFLRGEGELYKALTKVKLEAAQLNKKWMLIAKQNHVPTILFIPNYPEFNMSFFHRLFNDSVVMSNLEDFLLAFTPQQLLGDE